MTPLKWLLLAIGAIAVIAYTTWWYRTREETVPGRAWAGTLRGLALLFAWLIFINPAWPERLGLRRETEVAFLDASHSMSRPIGAAGPTVWNIASDSADRFEAVWLFGGPSPHRISADSIPAEPPYSDSRLIPALQSSALAGARRAVVYSDGELTDGRGAVEEARRLGIELSVVHIRPSYPQIGLSQVGVRRWIESGDAVEVDVEIVADAAADVDSVRVEVADAGGRVRASGSAPTPEPGTFARIQLRFAVAGEAGYRRFVARLTGSPGDLETRDDERPFYIAVSERPAGPVLISLRPDWEPSFLVSNLDRLTDAPTDAYLLLADGLVSLDDYRETSTADVARRARTAPLLALHGYGAASPEWARRLAANARRLLVIPAGAGRFELPGWQVRIGPPAPGEWYLSSEVPRSPLALELEGFAAEELPPLLRLRRVDGEASWAPLNVQRLRRGESLPAALAGVRGDRRWVVSAAEGYWRWAFRPGSGRQLYRALWTGLAGWLLEGRPRGDMGLEPVSLVVEKGSPLIWTVPGGSDSLSVELLGRDSSAVWAGTVHGADSLNAFLRPGRYRYRARAYISDGVASAGGPAEVEEFSRELLPRSPPPFAASQPSTVAGAASRVGRGRHLATLGWPYVVLILLFCAEWAVRRYIGLR